MIVAGIGCRRGCSAGAIVALVHRAEDQAGVRVDALAAPAFKDHEPGLLGAARQLGLVLHLVDRPALEAVQALCPTPSAAATRALGLASVAEAAALALAGTLLLPRISGGGATCALART